MRRVVQLVLSCVVLGVGIALLLGAALGSDGYSTLVNGLTLSSGWPFWVVNIVVSLLLVATAWARGSRPGLGTIVQPVVVGVTVSLVLAVLPTTTDDALRFAELGLAFVLVAIGVAGYLATDLGAGPTEAVALAWDPPVPFRWSYTVVQVGGALVGWLLGGAVGPGTLLVVLLIGPTVDLFLRFVFRREGTPPLADQRSA
ncbi:MAG: YczE/YyaS/YitT family protein [Candidatus Limnocylindria bacterium]